MDRNDIMLYDTSSLLQSLSARRAWIEILLYWEVIKMLLVALRKESVDRNNPLKALIILPKVALRKESVDRNIYIAHHLLHEGQRRSPQGERG